MRVCVRFETAGCQVELSRGDAECRVRRYFRAVNQPILSWCGGNVLSILCKIFSAKITASAMIECSAVPTLVACAFECHCNYYDKCHHSHTRDDADLCAFG